MESRPYVPEDDSRAAMGSLATDAARTAQVPCPRGRYSPGPGASECILCVDVAGDAARAPERTEQLSGVKTPRARHFPSLRVANSLRLG